MSYPQIALEQTPKLYDLLYRTARAVPAERLDWRPLYQGRSVLGQLRECALAPLWIAEVLRQRAMPANSREVREQGLAAAEAWTTLEQLETVSRANLDQLFAVIREFPADALEQRIVMSFGRERSFGEVMLMPMYNAMYHTGQINFIQMLYGDYEMH